MSETIPGSCLCGAVRFLVHPPSRFVSHCHCDNCRRAHGAAFVTWVGVPDGQLELTAQDALREYATETGATRSFCGTCGTPLFYRGPRWPDETHVAAACLTGPLDRAPKVRVYADRAPAWAPITDDLPRYGGADGVQPLS